MRAREDTRDVRILTWNLFHGRAVPNAGRSLRSEFAATLADWEWDVALLQEVPPWWPPELARAADAEERTALTSRNALLPLRRLVADRLPDLIKSNGGGANAILVRGRPVLEHRVVVLRRRPERRVAHAVRIPEGWVMNLHAQVHSDARAHADMDRAAAALRAWSPSGPALLGGDTNVRDPRAEGFTVLGGHDVDFVLGRAVTRRGEVERPPRGHLSDHAAVIVDVVGMEDG